MEKITTYVPLAARILIGLLFIVAGVAKLGDVASFTSYLTSGGLPAILTWPTILLEILGEVGGAKALSTLATAAKSSDPELQDTGSRLLGKWNGVDAAPVLLDLAKTAPA